MVDFHDAPVQMEPLLIDGSRPAYGALIGRSESASTFMRLDHCYRTSTRRETWTLRQRNSPVSKQRPSGNELAGETVRSLVSTGRADHTVGADAKSSGGTQRALHIAMTRALHHSFRCSVLQFVHET